MQTKKQSLIESISNVVVGYCIAILTQLIVFPLVGVDASFSQNIQIGIYFTLIALVRSYFIRRFFNNLT